MTRNEGGHNGFPLVLVVEDSAEIREYLELLLERGGYRVNTAGHGAEALAALYRGPHPSVILLDLMMPGMDGRALMDCLRADPSLASIPVIVFSANPRPVPEGAAAVLIKPSTPDEVLATVGRVTWRERRAAPRFAARLELTTHDGEQEGNAFSMNVSRGGVLFRSSSSAAVGQALTITLRLDPQKEVSIETEVRHVAFELGGWRVGAQFKNVGAGSDELESFFNEMERTHPNGNA
jgi:CheY-like chemotaxis protein